MAHPLVDHPLFGAERKLLRAEEHLDALNKQITCFLKEEAKRVLDKHDPNTGGYVRYIESSVTPPGWSVLLGDIAHNLHSCLDHIAWQFAVAASPTGNPEDDGWRPTDISFPLFACRRKYLRQRHRAWRHLGLLPAHRQLVRKAQPYQRRDAPESHPLWHLYRLSNIDKHQVLHTTLVGLGDTFPPPGQFTTKILDPETGEFEYVYEIPEGVSGEMEVVLRVGGPSEGDVYFKGDLPFQIEIEQPGTVLHEQPVLRLVYDIRKEVGAVLNAAKFAL